MWTPVSRIQGCDGPGLPGMMEFMLIHYGAERRGIVIARGYYLNMRVEVMLLLI